MKNILFIAPAYFNYEKLIQKELQKKHLVFFVPEILINKNIFRLISLVSNYLKNRLIDHYNKRLLKLINEKKIDTVFIIRGEYINADFLNNVKGKVKIIHYQWDSVCNNPNSLLICKYSDYNYSFDLKDTYTYPVFSHLPLFYKWDNNMIKKEDFVQKENIDILFVGSFHSRRDILIEEISKVCEQHGLNLKSHIYMRFFSYVKSFFLGMKVKMKNINFNKLSRDDLFKLMMSSKVILDIPSPSQSGATIRTIESLSLGKKIISTNKMLSKELFYSPDNIYIFDKFEVKDFLIFIETPFNKSKNNNIMELSCWLDSFPF